MKIISGNSNLPLAQKIASELNMDLADAKFLKFADQEIFIEICETVRNQAVHIIQSTSFPANDNLMEILIGCDALRRGSAQSITAVIPYFGYARQDRKSGPRTPISAKLVANLLTAAGINRVLTMDLHATQIQGFFDIPVDNLYGSAVLIPHIRGYYKDKLDNIVIVSPDVGGVVRARAFAKDLSCELAIIDKRREKAGISEVMHVIGDVTKKYCIIVDDMADSAGTLCNAAQALMENGAKSVSAYVTHGIFSGNSLDRIMNSKLKHIITTDTIKATEQVLNCPKVKIVTVAPIFADAMSRIDEGKSVSVLFEPTLF